MKTLLKPTNLPALVVGLGFVAQALRRLLYAVAVDARELLVSGHPLEIALGVLSLGALAWVAWSLRKLDGSDAYEDNFFPGRNAMLGHLAAAFGIVMTVLTTEPALGGYVGLTWTVLGYAAPLCLMVSGTARAQGKKPFFLLDLAPCLFLVLHLVCRYRLWSASAQLQHYVFALFGTIALMLFAFYTAAFSAGVGRRRMQLFFGLMAVYLLIAELAATDCSWLYLGGVLWALTDLCTLDPRPKREPQPEEET